MTDLIRGRDGILHRIDDDSVMAEVNARINRGEPEPEPFDHLLTFASNAFLACVGVLTVFVIGAQIYFWVVGA